MEADDPVALFERATTHAATLMSAVSPSQLNDATPCSRIGTCSSSSTTWWALAGEPPAARTDGTVEDDRRGLEQLRGGLRTPGALDRMCTSPLGFEWSVGHAVAGTSWTP